MRNHRAVLWIFGLAFLVTGTQSSPVLARGKLTRQDVEQIVTEKLATQEKQEKNWFAGHNFKPIFKSYLQYSLDLDTSAHQRRAMTQWDNAFDITRAYFGFDVDLTKHIMAEVKADINAKAAPRTPILTFF